MSEHDIGHEAEHEDQADTEDGNQHDSDEAHKNPTGVAGKDRRGPGIFPPGKTGALRVRLGPDL